MQFDVKIEVAGRRIYGDRTKGWGIVDLDGWWDSPDNNVGKFPVPGGYGTLPFATPTPGTVEAVIRGVAVSTTPMMGERDRAWLRSLAGLPDLEMRVWEQYQWLSVRGAQVNGRVRVDTDYRGHRTAFEIPITTYDPVRYGAQADPIVLDAMEVASGGLAWPVVDGSFDFGALPEVTFPGQFEVENVGLHPFHLETFVRGPVDGFQLISDNRVVEYSNPIPAGKTVSVSPYLGGRAVVDGTDVSVHLTRAEFTPVCPGVTQNYLFVPVNPGPGSSFRATHPEGAWL